MKTIRNLVIIFVVFGAGIALQSGVLPVFAESSATLAEENLYLPIVFNSVPSAIVADHRHTDISQIPDEWIQKAREFVVHYAHTSHGSQVLSGLIWLEKQDPRYNVDIQASGTVVLPSDATALRVYDGNNYPGDTYITPEQYWESEDGKDHTRSVMDKGWFDVSLWTWCGQMSYYSDAQIQEYIDVMAQFESEYPDAAFVYYTGHTDGSAPPSTLWRHNDMVRQHVQETDGVLFDFADIESYDPDGNFYPDASDSCEWCEDWCAAHPTSFECQHHEEIPYCAHTHDLQCALKGQAFWYMMARLAGWDGVTK
ncbi:MAG: hypothetical protein ABFS39_14770 [Pseudomonadota bacterium]